MSEEKHRRCSKNLHTVLQQNDKQDELENVTLPHPPAHETCNKTHETSSSPNISFKYDITIMNTFLSKQYFKC